MFLAKKENIPNLAVVSSLVKIAMKKPVMKNKLRGHRILIIQHLFDDTEKFVSYLSQCMSLETIIGIEYSKRQDIVKRLERQGFVVICPPLGDIERMLPTIIQNELEKVKERKQKLIILDLGGYCAASLSKSDKNLLPYLAGIIEDTSRGVWLYESLPKLSVPVFQVAYSPLKKIESQLVGSTVVLSLKRLIGDIGKTIVGKKVLVLGYGQVGGSVALALRKERCVVYIYDTDPLQRIRAFFDGFIVARMDACLEACEIIIGATGKTTITKEVIKHLRDGALIASASSCDVEIDVSYLYREAEGHEITPSIKVYECNNHTENKKRIILLNEGKPINFLERSVPTEAMDLIMSEIFMCICELVSKDYSNKIHSLSTSLQRDIADRWLEIHTSTQPLKTR